MRGAKRKRRGRESKRRRVGTNGEEDTDDNIWGNTRVGRKFAGRENMYIYIYYLRRVFSIFDLGKGVRV